MSCLSERDLEILYYSEQNNTYQDLSSFEHIKECSFCAQRLQSFREFCREFNHEYIRPINLSELRLVLDITRDSSPWVSIAYPFNMTEHSKWSKELEPVLMAATNIDKEHIQFENLGVLSTQDDKVIVRIMRSLKNGEVTLHLISEDEKKYSNVLVRISSLKKEFVSDENGKVHLGVVTLPDVKELYAEIQTPFATFNLSALDLTKDKLIAQTDIVLTNDHNDSIKVEFIPNNLDYTLKVHLLKVSTVNNKDTIRVLVVRGKRDSLLAPFQKGVAVFQGLKHNGELQVKVFD